MSGQPIPAVGTAGTGYASQIVAFLNEVKARLENKVALTSLLAGLFDLSNNAIANAKYIGLYEQSSPPTTPVGSVQAYNGDLYYVSASGAVRITNGNTLNVTAAQGITGNYGSGPEEFKYVLADLEYYAYSNQGAAPKQWARVGAQGFDIYGTLTGTTRVRLAWAGGANPSYTLTLPATVPGVKKLLQMDTSGNVLTDNTGVDDLTLTANKHVTVSGTGRFKHGGLSFSQQIKSDIMTSGSGVSVGTSGSGIISLAIVVGATTFNCLLRPLDTGKRITSVTILGNYESGSAAATYDLMRYDVSSGTFSSVLSGAVTSTNNAPTPVTLTPGGGGYTVGTNTNNTLWLRITVPAATTIAYLTFTVNYDHP